MDLNLGKSTNISVTRKINYTYSNLSLGNNLVSRSQCIKDLLISHCKKAGQRLSINVANRSFEDLA
jgi:hypothetical protein